MTAPTTVPVPFFYNATVVDVHDGDTFSVRVDYGRRNYEEPVPIRLLGGAARELREPGGKEARDNLAALLPPGTAVVLATVDDDKYGPRWDARVFYERGGVVRDLVAGLIADHWLAPWDGRGAQPKPPFPRPTS